MRFGFDEFHKDGVARRLPGNPSMWSDGSLVLEKVSGASFSGSGVYAHVPGDAWSRTFDMVQPARGSFVDSCWGFYSVPGPLLSAQRAELWEEGRRGILAPKALNAVHVGIDNLSVVRHVSRLVDGVELAPF